MRAKMNPEIKTGFDNLATKREELADMLKNRSQVSVQHLNYWPSFIGACSIAETCKTDGARLDKLERAKNHLIHAKSELNEHGIHPDDFSDVDQALESLVTVISKVVDEAIAGTAVKYRAHISEVKGVVIDSETTTKHGK